MTWFLKKAVARGSVRAGLPLAMIILVASSCASVNAEATVSAVKTQSTSTSIANPRPDSLPLTGADTLGPQSTEPVDDAALNEVEKETGSSELAVDSNATTTVELQEDPESVSLPSLDSTSAQLGQLDGWNAVDTPPAPASTRLRSADCSALNEVLALDEWGVITKSWLHEGTELRQHTAELGSHDDVAAYLRSVAALANCGDVELGGTRVTASHLDMDPFTGVTLDVAETVEDTWLLRGGSRSSLVVVSRDNVVSVLQVIPLTGFDMSEFEALGHRTLDAIDSLTAQG